MIKEGADMTPEGGLIVPDEIQRKRRVEYYLENSKKEIEEMRKAGREKEAKIMESRLALAEDKWHDEKHHIYDVMLFGDREEVVYDDIKGAKKQMDAVMLKREGEAEWQTELNLRLKNKEVIKNLQWEAIDFGKNMDDSLKTLDPDKVSHQSQINGIQFVKKFLVSGRGPSKIEGDSIEECYSTEFGHTANHADAITEEHKQGLESLLGQKIPTERVDDIHYTYTPDAKLAAVEVTLNPDTGIDLDAEIKERQKPYIIEGEFPEKGGRQWGGRYGGVITIIDKKGFEKAEKDVEKEFADRIKKTPFLGRGSLIIKKDGTRYFLPEITWKQYPCATPSGRVIMTFAGGASRGIFDEESCFTNSHWGTSTGRRVFSTQDPNAYNWTGEYVKSGVYDGKKLPPARMEYDEKNKVIVVGVDAYDEGKKRVVSNIE